MKRQARFTDEDRGKKKRISAKKKGGEEKDACDGPQWRFTFPSGKTKREGFEAVLGLFK